MATFKLASSPPLHRASSRYYHLLIAKALLPVQRGSPAAAQQLQVHHSRVGKLPVFQLPS